jgi:hypothetical protein
VGLALTGQITLEQRRPFSLQLCAPVLVVGQFTLQRRSVLVTLLVPEPGRARVVFRRLDVTCGRSQMIPGS